MTLRGPADADHYRVHVGRYRDRWYVDPLPGCPIAPLTDDQWPSVSTVKKGGNGQDWSFVALKRAAQSLSFNPLQLDGLGYGELYDRLKSINQRGLEAAALRGTQVHTMFELGLRGQPMDVFSDDQPGAEYLPAVAAFFDQYQPELVAAEVVAINRTLNGVGYGGTGDAIVKIEGRTYWPDWKSRGEDSNHGAYPEEGAQIGGYALADYLIIEGPGGPQRIRVPDLDGGLIVSVKPDGCRIYPVDLKQAGELWTELHRWWCARQHEREAIGKPWAPRKIAAPVEKIADPTIPNDVCGMVTWNPTGGTGAPCSLPEGHAGNHVPPRKIAAPMPPAVVEPPAGEVHTAVASPAETVGWRARRAALLHRFNNLADEDQARYKELNPDRTDLDAVEKALDEVDPFALQERPESHTAVSTPAPAALALPTPSAEGRPVDDATFEPLERTFYDLPEDRRMWVHNVILEADQAAVPFRANKSAGRRTVRRYELYRGLITLAGADLADDEVVRELVATVLDNDAPFFPVFSVGQVVGSLDVYSAKAFAEFCDGAATASEPLNLRSRPAGVA